MTATERTIERLKLWGFSISVVERFVENKATGFKMRKDAFGFGDILACKDHGENKGVWLVQSTVAGAHAARKKKALAIAFLRVWLIAGGRFVIVSWNGPKMRWEEITCTTLETT